MTRAIALLVTFVIAASPALAHRDVSVMSAEAPVGEIILAKVEGLDCDMCAQPIRDKVGAAPAVHSVAVHVADGRVVVSLKQGTAMQDEALISLIREAGYKVISLERGAEK